MPTVTVFVNLLGWESARGQILGLLELSKDFVLCLLRDRKSRLDVASVRLMSLWSWGRSMLQHQQPSSRTKQNHYSAPSDTCNRPIMFCFTLANSDSFRSPFSCHAMASLRVQSVKGSVGFKPILAGTWVEVFLRSRLCIGAVSGSLGSPIGFSPRFVANKAAPRPRSARR